METRDKIIDGFFRIAEKNPTKLNFSVTEIAKEAGVSRQAIYRYHFDNQADIIEAVHRIVDDEILKTLEDPKPQPGVSPFQLIADYALPLLYERKEWLRVLYTTSIDPTWMFFLEKQYMPWAQRYVKDSLGVFGVSKEFMTKLVVKRTLSVISIWLSEKEPDAPETFKSKFLTLVTLSVNEQIKEEYRLDFKIDI